MRTLTSLPSRVLMPSVLPSTLSMVPRMRTVGVCCARADDVTMQAADAATPRRDIQVLFDMLLVSVYIGGVRPSRPTLTRLVSNEPSGSCFMKAITLAPVLSSDLSAGTYVTTGVSGETCTFFSPSLYLT